jgi:CubicO group peptidase (beta-lactamase class C family)
MFSAKDSKRNTRFASRTDITLAGRVALCIALLAAAPSFAGTPEEIARVEKGLRAPVALAGVPVAVTALADEMRRLNVPGVSVAVIRNGEIRWAKGYGVTHANGPAVTPSTLFQAASISKPVAAMGALRMVEEGKLALDADINTMLTSWKLPPGPGEAKATLRQLLSHTAGTGVHGFPGYAAGAAVPTALQVLDGSGPANTKAVRIDSVPGAAWKYSGGGYTIVQQAMVERGGKTFEDLLADSVLKPIGMNDSTFAQPLPAALLGRAALPHDRNGEPVAGGPHTHPEQAAAGLWTTPTDLARFALEVQRSAAGAKGVLSPAMVRTMLTPVRQQYGLGLEIEGEGAGLSFGHGGSNVGYKTSLYAYAANGDGVVVMTNGDRGGELAGGLLRAIAAEYGWPSDHTRVRKAVELSAAALGKLAGRYEIKNGGTFELAIRDGLLMLATPDSPFEPVYAESEGVLFVLSRDLELRMEPGTGAGRLVFGSWETSFQRID